MVQRAFEFLFVISLLAPAAAVVFGVLLVAWPHRLRVDHASKAPAQARA